MWCDWFVACSVWCDLCVWALGGLFGLGVLMWLGLRLDLVGWVSCFVFWCWFDF